MRWKNWCLLSAVVVCLAPAAVQADYISEVAADAPFQWYRMQELNVTGGSIAQNSGSTGTGGTYTMVGTGGNFTDVAGMASGLTPAKQFTQTSVNDGVAIGLDAQGSAYAALTAFTVEFLFKPADYTGTTISAIYSSNSVAAGCVHVNLSGGTLDFWTLKSGSLKNTLSNYAPVGEWSHLALTSEYSTTTGSTTLRQYVNGEEVASKPYNGALTANFDQLANIGQYYPGTGTNGKRLINDAVDEFAVYDRALSSNEVLAHYSATVPEPGTSALMAAGLISLLAYAWRKRK